MVPHREEDKCWLDAHAASGVRIRDDVRRAVHTIWRIASQKTSAAMGDAAETATLMELAAVDASKYLDGLGADAANANVPAVLRRIFCRLLSRRAVRFRKLEPAGEKIEFLVSVPSWEDKVNRRLLFIKLQSYMSQLGVTILTRRREGYEWDEIAPALRMTVTAVKTRFWREIENAKAELKIGTEARRRGKPKAS